MVAEASLAKATRDMPYKIIQNHVCDLFSLAEKESLLQQVQQGLTRLCSSGQEVKRAAALLHLREALAANSSDAASRTFLPDKVVIACALGEPVRAPPGLPAAHLATLQHAVAQALAQADAWAAQGRLDSALALAAVLVAAQPPHAPMSSAPAAPASALPAGPPPATGGGSAPPQATLDCCTRTAQQRMGCAPPAHCLMALSPQQLAGVVSPANFFGAASQQQVGFAPPPHIGVTRLHTCKVRTLVQSGVRVLSGHGQSLGHHTLQQHLP